MTSQRATPPSDQRVTQALDGVQDPEIHRPITELGMVKHIDVGADGTVLVEVYLTVAGCPLRDTITREVTAAVGKLPGVSSVRVRLDVMSDEQRRALQTQLRGGRPEPQIPFAQPTSLTRVYAVASGKGGVGKSSVTVNLGRRAGRLGPEGRGGGRRHLRALGAADAGRHRPAHAGREHDHAAVRARREGHLDRHVHQGQHARGLARADAAPRAAAVPGRRVLGRSGRAAARPAARHR
jgi:metal-sulfur cluster biosynthetic enzyme